MTALVNIPVLSPDFFDGWNDTDAVLEMPDSGRYVLNHHAGDSLLIAEISTTSYLVMRLYILDSSGGVLYDGAFNWSITGDSVPLLRDVRLAGFSGFERGGVEFFNIVINGESSIRGRASMPPVKQPAGITIRRSGGTVRFIAPPGVTHAAIYDILGRTIFDVAYIAPGGFLWDGRTSQGVAVAPGWFTAVGFIAGSPVAQQFCYQR